MSPDSNCFVARARVNLLTNNRSTVEGRTQFTIYNMLFLPEEWPELIYP